MLCPSCRRQLERGASYCGSCGTPLNGAARRWSWCSATRRGCPVVAEMTIGRAPGATLVLVRPVGLARARADLRRRGARGRRLLPRDVAGRRARDRAARRCATGRRSGSATPSCASSAGATTAEAGRTIVVRAGASLLVPSVGPASVTGRATQFGMRAAGALGLRAQAAGRVRGPPALGAAATSTRARSCGSRDNDAWLFELLDGSHSLVELVGLAEQRFGPRGPARLARLLSDLGERGFLERRGRRRSRRPSAPHEPAGAAVQAAREDLPRRRRRGSSALYRAGGWVLFTRPVLIALAVLIVAGIAAFVGADRRALRDAVRGRQQVRPRAAWCSCSGASLVVAVHETAHGLTMASFGRRIERAGLKLIAIFPYAFVDTSEAWFEPRRRRIAVSAAGPVSDFSIGAVFALCALLLPDGHRARHLLQPRVRGLRRRVLQPQPVHRARRLPHARRLAATSRGCGGGRRSSSSGGCAARARRPTRRCSRATRCGASAGRCSRRASRSACRCATRRSSWRSPTPRPVVYGVMGTLWVAFFLPVIFVLGKPLLAAGAGG